MAFRILTVLVRRQVVARDLCSLKLSLLSSHSNSNVLCRRLGDLTNQGRLRDRKISVFWDLDNKPPKNVPPFDAATRLKEMAAEFGYLDDVVAYANYHAFTHVPAWVEQERKQRRLLDNLEAKGVVKPEVPYICNVCGSKKKTNLALTKHFKMLHEREHDKRMNRLESLKGKKKQKERFWDQFAAKESKYKDAERNILVPKFGYRLEQDLRRAGVFVRTVKDEPEAADIALKDHMRKSMLKGMKCICLVSDDSGFSDILKTARDRGLYTIVVGDLRVLSSYADAFFSWSEVASGMAGQKAKLLSRQWQGEDVKELLDSLETRECETVKACGFEVDDEHTSSESESDGETEWVSMKRNFPSRETLDSFENFPWETSDSEGEEETISETRKPEGGEVDSSESGRGRSKEEISKESRRPQGEGRSQKHGRKSRRILLVKKPRRFAETDAEMRAVNDFYLKFWRDGKW